MGEKLYDLKEAAKYLNISIAYVRKLVYARNIPFYRIGNRLKFDKEEIDVWLESKKSEERKRIII